MKTVRIILYGAILSAPLFIPLQRIENVILETDTEDIGIGVTVETALADMRKNSTKIIYLDTAQYVFVSAEAQQQIPMLQPFVKPSVRLCQWEGQGSIQAAKEYADARNMGRKLSKWQDGSNLPELPPIK